MKRYFLIFLSACLIFSLVGCGKQNNSILVEDNIEIDAVQTRDEIHEVALKLLKFSNNSLGFSAIGTQADRNKLEYLEGVFKDIGLSNIHTVDIPMDSWVLDDVSLTYECNCEQVENKTIYSIGTYPRNFNYNSEYMQMVNVGDGKEEDFDRVGDLHYKGVLFSNSEDLESKVKMAVDKGAEFIIYVDTSDNRINPSSFKIDLDLDYANKLSKEVPIFVISDMIFSTINADVPLYNSTTVQLKGHSDIQENIIGSFLIGEIEGKNKDEVIYVTANRDTINKGYLSSCQSIGFLKILAEELVKEKIKPNCTIRFLITTGQEWGSENGGFNIGIEKYIEENKKENIKYVISLDGINLLETNKDFDIYTSSDVFNTVNSINSKINYNIVKNVIIKIENNIEEYYDLEGYSWLNKGYSVIMATVPLTSEYYMYKDTNKDEPSIGIGSDVSKDMLMFYIQVLNELSSK